MQYTRGWFVEHLSLTQETQQSLTESVFSTIMNLVTSKAGAKHELFVQQTSLSLMKIYTYA